MKQPQSLLQISTPEISSEAKYALVCFWHQHGHGDGAAVRRTVKELAAEWGVSDRVVTKALRELGAANALVCTRVSEGRGRPSYSYRISSWYIDQLAQKAGDEKGEAPHAEIIQAVLESSKMGGISAYRDDPEGSASPAKARKRGRPGKGLDSVNRLVLMVLLAHADDSGVVRGMGPARLAELVGIKKDRFQRQVGKLRELGYIRAVIPGVSGQRLFGVVPGAYYLNLAHPAYGDAAVGCVSVVFELQDLTWVPEGLRGSEADQLIQLAASDDEPDDSDGSYGIGVRINPRYPGNWVDLENRIRELAEFLKPSLPPGFSEFLQMRIEDYAAHLLSEYWVDLQPFAMPFTDPDVLSSVHKELFRKDMHPDTASEDAEARREREFAECIYHLAWRKAESLRLNLAGSPFSRWLDHRARYLLLPPVVGDQTGYIPVLAFSRRKSRPAYFLAKQRGRFNETSEIEPSLEQMTEFGLLAEAGKQ